MGFYFKMMKKILLFFILGCLNFAVFSQPDGEISFSLFLIGNSGKYDPDNQDHEKMFKSIIDYDNNPKGIILTGNNVFLSLKEIITENFEPRKNTKLFKKLQSFDGKICIVPGVTDWAYGTSYGKEMIKCENKTIHEILKNKEIYMPEGACPGPVEVPVNDSLVVILLDTQWWLHPFDTRFGKCDLEDKSDVWTNLQDALRRNRNKQIVVAGYHPVISYGQYGGYYPAIQRFLGFPVSLYRKYLGTHFDLAYPDYRQFISKLKSILEEFPNVIYASSHEQNFQYLTENNIHYIIGGSLAGGKYIKEKKLECGDRDAGYSRIDFYRDGKVELLFFPLDAPKSPLCNSDLYTYHSPKNNLQTSPLASELFPDSVTQAASTQYESSPRVWKWMGKNYRDVWAQPVKTAVFDIQKEHGGLKIIKRGGGQQTHSIRLEDFEGHQYNLRSLEKYVKGALPANVSNTFAVDVVQDNISASNPYAALAVARLADAAGVMHTNPGIVYIPRDYRLGEYTEDLTGHLFLYEERPAGNWSGTRSFGYSKNIVGTDDVIENTQDSPCYQVDQQAVLKARIFDTFINDWDRHDDQWRWASFMNDQETIYRPIPRDRDQAFYVNEGIIPKIAARKWLMPKIQGFAPLTPNMDGLAFNARYFDRAFLTEPGWSQWKSTVDSLKSRLTDAQIANAMLAFPKEIQPLCADRIASILKKRRDNLEIMAREHYLSLAKNVNVTGTNENDIFEVIRKNNLQTDVSIYEDSDKKNKKQPYYHRTFSSDETKEIRLYGLKGDDYYKLEGNVSNGILVRIIGGKGKDTIINQSSVKTAGKQTVIYDLKKNTVLIPNKDTRNQLSRNKNINNYNRMGFKYNVVTPGIFMGYNHDDGLFIGGGPVFKQNKFRKNETHSIMGNFATLTNAFNLRYTFDSESTTNRPDHHISVELKAPDYAMNFFGMGNRSIKSNLFNDSYYRLRVNQLLLNYNMGYRWGKTVLKPTEEGSVNQSELRFGIFLKRSNIEEKPGYFISDLTSNGLNTDDLDRQLFAGLSARYTYSILDQEVNPQRGIEFSFSGEQFFQIGNKYHQFLRLNADFRTYISFTKNPRAILAFRLGGASLFGNYSFLEAAKLGGKTNLRGYLSDRFYGDQSIYQNLELRYKIADFSSYILNGEIGVLTFYDAGRVWYENEKSQTWHKGYGGGLWISPFEMTIFTVTYNHSNEDDLVQFTMNFKF